MKCTKTVGSRAAPFGSDMHQIICQLGLCPRPHWGSLLCSPDPLAGLGGGAPRGKGRREGRGKGRREESPGMPKSRVGKPNLAWFITTLFKTTPVIRPLFNTRSGIS